MSQYLKTKKVLMLLSTIKIGLQSTNENKQIHGGCNPYQTRVNKSHWLKLILADVLPVHHTANTETIQNWSIQSRFIGDTAQPHLK